MPASCFGNLAPDTQLTGCLAQFHFFHYRNQESFGIWGEEQDHAKRARASVSCRGAVSNFCK
jgi:hypothetical protein